LCTSSRRWLNRSPLRLHRAPGMRRERVAGSSTSPAPAYSGTFFHLCSPVPAPRVPCHSGWLRLEIAFGTGSCTPPSCATPAADAGYMPACYAPTLLCLYPPPPPFAPPWAPPSDFERRSWAHCGAPPTRAAPGVFPARHGALFSLGMGREDALRTPEPPWLVLLLLRPPRRAHSTRGRLRSITSWLLFVDARVQVR